MQALCHDLRFTEDVVREKAKDERFFENVLNAADYRYKRRLPFRLMPTPDIPSPDLDWENNDIASHASSEVVKSILIDVPGGSNPPELGAVALLREQLDDEIQRIIARLQAVETQLGITSPAPKPPKEEAAGKLASGPPLQARG